MGDSPSVQSLPVTQHAGESGNLGEPATLFFAFELDREVTRVMYHPGRDEGAPAGRTIRQAANERSE